MKEKTFILKDQNAVKNDDSRGLALEVSEGNKDFVGNWARGQCYIVPRSLRAFCLSLENLNEAEPKIVG